MDAIMTNIISKAVTAVTYAMSGVTGSCITLPIEQIVSRNALLNHTKALRELKQKFTPEHIALDLPIGSNGNPGLTQTEAYLSRYAHEVESVWPKALTEHKELIEQVIKKEKEFSQSHYALYHAHKIELIILHDLLKELHCLSTVENVSTDFSFLRNKETNRVTNNSINDYLNYLGIRSDNTSEIASQMISVNLSLFGNRTMINSSECTFDYFLNNKNIRSALEGALKSIFTTYNFDQKYLKKILELKKHLVSPTGNLIQILVPKKLINKVAYPARANGYPDTENYNLHNGYIARDTSITMTNKLSALLDKYCKEPNAIPNLDTLQTRIVFFDDLFDPLNDIKMIRYNTVPSANMMQYEKELHHIVDCMMTEYLQKPNTRGEALFRLQRYINGGSLS